MQTNYLFETYFPVGGGGTNHLNITMFNVEKKTINIMQRTLSVFAGNVNDKKLKSTSMKESVTIIKKIMEACSQHGTLPSS